ncbi:MAG: diguanylate cyclase, partial [Oscillospiraceae bacterium]
KSGVFPYEKNEKEKKFVAYAPIDHLNGWYIMSFVSTEPILKKSNYIISLTTLLLVIVTIVISIIYIYIYLIKRKTRRTFEYLAYTDSLTGCKSWPKFTLDLEEILKKSKDKRYAYIYLNIKNFKFINDIMGFNFGNELLKHISHSIAAITNPNEIFTRINADRFCLMIE